MQRAGQELAHELSCNRRENGSATPLCLQAAGNWTAQGAHWVKMGRNDQFALINPMSWCAISLSPVHFPQQIQTPVLPLCKQSLLQSLVVPCQMRPIWLHFLRLLHGIESGQASASPAQ